MNHCVPEFEMDDEYSIHSSSAQNRPRKSTVMPEDDIMELLWQDGQVVVQSQNQRPVKKFPPSRYDAVPLPDQSAPRETRPATHEIQPQNQNLFMQEDEMASWLHYPLNDAEYHSEDIEFESADAKKQARGSSSTKRSRAAEVHNLSERRRRDRINEKMKALQELIPRCNKSDKASMLDEAIEYLKSLQLQVQMMSMGCSMVPMMFPGVQQYMPQMGLGMGMRMGMGLEMGMNRPMMHYPNVLPGSTLPPPAPPGHVPPRFPVPSFPMPLPDQARINSPDPGMISNPLGMQNPNQQQVPSFPDPYQQYLGFHQMQLPQVPQDQGMGQPSTTRGAESRENDQPG